MSRAGVHPGGSTRTGAQCTNGGGDEVDAIGLIVRCAEQGAMAARALNEAILRHVALKGTEILAHFVGGQANQRGTHTDNIGTGIAESPHIISTADTAATDDRTIQRLGHLPQASQADRQHALAGHTARTVAQYRIAV